MRLTIEISRIDELEQLLLLLKSLQIEEFKIISGEGEFPVPAITKGDRSIAPEGLFGLWKEDPRNLADIRNSAWERGQSRA